MRRDRESRDGVGEDIRLPADSKRTHNLLSRMGFQKSPPGAAGEADLRTLLRKGGTVTGAERHRDRSFRARHIKVERGDIRWNQC